MGRLRDSLGLAADLFSGSYGCCVGKALIGF